MAIGRLVKGGCDDLGIDRTRHIGHLFGSFVDEEHHEIRLGMVGGDGIGNILHEDGLTGLGLCHDECTLSLTDG